MNRVIKFRGLRHSGEWVYGFCVERWNNKRCVAQYTPKERSDEKDCYEDHWDIVVDVYEDSVGQYTGLKDRKGKEIYEGDIVFWIATDSRGRGRGEQGAIIWDAPTMSWAILRDKPTVDGRPCIISRPFDRKHLEVIGNIFDNPDMMKL